MANQCKNWKPHLTNASLHYILHLMGLGMFLMGIVHVILSLKIHELPCKHLLVVRMPASILFGLNSCGIVVKCHFLSMITQFATNSLFSLGNLEHSRQEITSVCLTQCKVTAMGKG